MLVTRLDKPVQLLRVRKEEHVLEERFGDAYREYKRKTCF